MFLTLPFISISVNKLETAVTFILMVFASWSIWIGSSGNKFFRINASSSFSGIISCVFFISIVDLRLSSSKTSSDDVISFAPSLIRLLEPLEVRE